MSFSLPTGRRRRRLMVVAPTIAAITLLAACSADPAAREANERVFLGKMGLGGLRSIADAPVRELPRLRNALLTKASVLEQRKGAEPAAAAHARQPIRGEAAR